MVRCKFAADGHGYYSLQLDTEALTRAVTVIASEARKAADKAVLKYTAIAPKELARGVNPGAVARFRIRLAFASAYRYSRFACDMEYLRDSRIAWLPRKAEFAPFIDETGYRDFRHAANGKPYSLRNLVASQ